MWSDKETAVDSLNVQHIVRAIVTLLDMEHLTPVTIGVYGDWGSGKSSVALMLQRHLTEGDRGESTLCVTFNSWLFEGYEDAKTALLSTILEAIADRSTLGSDIRDGARKLLRSVDAMKMAKSAGRLLVHVGAAAATGGATLPVSMAAEAARMLSSAKPDDVVDAVGGFVKDGAGDAGVHRSVRTFASDFADLLDKTTLKRVVVIVDDLDRCNPTQVIDTLEAIRLFVAAPKTAFIIAADDKMIQNAARLRFPGLESRPALGRAYLEKMVQVPIRVPPLGPGDLETYLNMLFLQLHLSDDAFRGASARLLARTAVERAFRVTANNAHEIIGVPLTEPMRLNLALASQILRVVAMSVDGNPRQVKRFLNAMRLRLLVADARGVHLDPRVAAKLMLLEYFRTEAFRTVARWQAAHDGKALELSAIETRGVAAASSSAVADGSETGAPGSRKSTRGRRAVIQPAEVAVTPPTSAAPSVEGDSGAPTSTEPPPEASAWLADEWMSAWLETDPALGSTDLAPYMYFARDRLSGMGGAAERMSPAAREILADLQGEGTVAKQLAAKRSKDLPSTEVAAILGALADSARDSDTITEASSPLAAMLALIPVHPALTAEFLAAVRSLPVTRLAPGTPNRVMAFVNGMPPDAQAQLRALLGEWTRQTDNLPLATAARIALRGSQ